MHNALPLALLATSFGLAMSEAALAHDFSVDPTSPEVLQFRYGSSDVIDQAGGGPILFASNLGIGTDELDGFSYGKVRGEARDRVEIRTRCARGRRRAAVVGKRVARGAHGHGPAGLPGRPAVRRVLAFRQFHVAARHLARVATTSKGTLV